MPKDIEYMFETVEQAKSFYEKERSDAAQSVMSPFPREVGNKTYWIVQVREGWALD